MRHKVHRFFLVVLCLTMLTADPAGFYAAKPPEIRFDLTILHTNDFHGADVESLPRIAALIRRIRDEAENPVLVLDAGDLFARGPYHYKFFGELEVAAYNAAGYDAVTIGNNEFKAKSDASARSYLLKLIREGQFAWLCANIRREDGKFLPGVVPYIVKEYNGIKVGIFGVTSPKVKRYRQLGAWRYTDYLAESIAVCRELKEKEKVNIIVALTHIGYGADQVLARKAPGISVIVGGDSHTTIRKPAEERGVVIVQAGAYGRYMGRLDLHFAVNGRTTRLLEYEGGLIRFTPDMAMDRTVKEVVDRYLNKSKKKEETADKKAG